ncbi:MAG: GNAT family N-acetyltransferase [Faecousia sp.]
MEAEYGTALDIESWMELVRQVRWNFPGLETQAALEDHRQTVLRFMGEKRALCVKENGRIIGVLLFSKTHNMICCLAVDPAHRRNGIASALLSKALAELDRSKDIIVTTFRENDEKGTAPRGLYKRFGFAEGKLMVEFGYPVQEFVLRGKH